LHGVEKVFVFQRTPKGPVCNESLKKQWPARAYESEGRTFESFRARHIFQADEVPEGAGWKAVFSQSYLPPP
jgi:hypothetical protein